MSRTVSLNRPPAAASLDLGGLPRVDVPGLYVHIPFCFHKCHYCDFYSITRQTPQRMEAFVDRLLREADHWLARGPSVRPWTIFFGGGTPSLLPLAPMRRLIVGLRERFDLGQVAEWTVEINPATADLDYCQMLREAGVDRLSFGAQSFDEAELKTLERHHHPADLQRSIGLARAAGFLRMNVDLIYAIPGQSIESWARSLDLALALGTTHLSAYNLTFEPNTAMAVRLRLGEFEAAEETTELAMLHHARARLGAADLLPYEISNYASPGQECRHNLLYWTGGSYAGLGPGAASHVAGHRFKNRPHLGEWEEAIDAGRLAVVEHEILTPAARVGERVMLQIRLAQGVAFADLDEYAAFDVRTAYADLLGRLAGAGLIEVDEVRFELTPRGLNVADAIAAEFVRADNQSDRATAPSGIS